MAIYTSPAGPYSSALGLMTSNGDASGLCLSCGFCCNGALFRDVELNSSDRAAHLHALGLPVEQLARKVRIPQPCAALCTDNACRVYADRPSHCRQFECALLQSWTVGRLSTASALRTIQLAQNKRLAILRLLSQLGEERTDLPLLARFQRTVRRMERRPSSKAEALAFARLTSAFHTFQLLLQKRFVPRR